MKRLVVLLFLSVLPVYGLLAQKKGRQLIDSLLIELPYVEDMLKVRIYSTLCQVYTHINPDTSIYYGEKGIAFAKEIGWNKGIMQVANSIGGSYQNRSDHATALKYYLEALKISKEVQQSIATGLGNIGNVYYAQKAYDKALDHYLQGLKINESIGNKEKMATVLGNIANVYMYFYDTSARDSKYREINKQKALAYFDRSIKLYEEVGNKNGIARNKGNIGNLYKDEDDLTISLRHYKEALELSKVTDNKLMQLAMQINMAMLYKKVAEDTTGRAKIESYTNRDKAILVNKGLVMATELVKEGKAIGYNELLYEGLGTLSALYKMKGDYKKAFEAQEEFIALMDTLHRLNNEETVAKLEAKNKSDQQEKEIEIQKLAVAKKRNTNWFMGIGIVVLLFVIRFVIKERKKSETVLLNILPKKIAERLKAKEHPIADQFTGPLLCSLT
jgi:tetratricopeptide (TPR) repeat protein